MRVLFLLLIFLSSQAWAVVATQPNVFVPYTPIKASQVNADFQAIIAVLNGNIDGATNITAGSISTANLASAAIIASKIAPGSITKILEAPNGMLTSTSSSNYITTSTTDVGIFANPVIFQSFGNPVFVGLQGSTSPSFVQTVGATQNTGFITWFRDGATTNIAEIGSAINTQPNIANPNSMTTDPCSAFSFVDSPAAGIHNYSLSGHATGNTAASALEVTNCRLVIYEL